MSGRFQLFCLARLLAIQNSVIYLFSGGEGTSGIMANGKATEALDYTNRSSVEKLETLNFKVTVDFKKAFKGYAVAQGMTMVDLLREGFELSKASRKS